MLDENGTEASREGALNAYESLFGDTVAAPPAELGKEQEVSIEPDQNQQGSDLDEEEQAVVAEIAPPDDLKVVVSIREGRASIGVQQLSSDPYIESFDDREVSKLAQEVPAVLERARARWEDAPKHPAYERPTPSTGRRPRREQPPAQNPTAEGEAAEQQPETLRLF